MADKPDITPPVSGSHEKTVVLSDSASAQAPFLYFEDATAFGHYQGMIRITLESCRLIAKEGNQVSLERVIVANLRMTIASAQQLRIAIDKALLLAAPLQSEAKN